MKVKTILKKCKNKAIKVIDFCIKYRYIIAIIAFIIMVACKINFSSVDAWSLYVYGGDEQSGTILGTYRAIRSDEWLVQTPYIMSQISADGFYELYNEKIGQGANMILRRSSSI